MELLKHKYALSNKITDGPHKKLSFQVHTTHVSYLQLALHDSTKPLSDNHKAVIIKLGQDSCRSLEVHEVDKSHYEYLAEEQVDHSYGGFHLMLIDCNPDLVSDEGLFVEDTGLHDTMKTFLQSSTVYGLLIKSRNEDDLRINAVNMTRRFTAESKPTPLYKMISDLQGHVAYKIRPYLSPVPRVSFINWEDYMSVLRAGAKIVKEIVEKKTMKPIVSSVVFLRHEAGSRKFIALFKVPRRRQEDFAPGEKASASFRSGDYSDKERSVIPYDSDDEESSSENDSADDAGRKPSRLPWDVKILRPIPSSGKGVSTALVERRRYKASEDFIDTQSLPVTTLGDTFRASPAAFRRLLEQSEMSTKLILDFRHSIFCYVIQGQKELGERFHSVRAHSVDKASLKVLLGNNLTTVPKFNIYWALSNEAYANEECMDLNESQKVAIRLARQAPGGFVICHGGPGTGKTHFVIQAVKPFLLDTKADHRILLTSAGNRGADSMAHGLDRLLQQLINGGQTHQKRYVVRLHSIKTEMTILLRDANISREKALENKRKPKAVASEGATAAPDLSHPVLAHCQTFAACKFEGVQDVRVQDITLSLGQRMLEVAGLKGGRLSDGAPPFQGFRRFYSKYSRGETLSNNEQEEWDLETKELMSYTINHATALCATVAGAADSFVAESYKDAELLVVDEASRVPEFQWWPLLAFYPNAAGKMMVGDPDQLPPHIETDDKVHNPFLKQLEISLQGRLQAAGFVSAFFTVQYRACPQIAEIYNTACYGSRLLDDPTTSISSRPLAQAIVRHNLQHYGMGQPVVFRDVPKADAKRLESGSKFCAAYAVAVLRILLDLLISGFGTSVRPCHIAILTPYKEQQRILQISRTRMAEVYPAAANVTIETVDSVQGIEYDIVIVDPVAVRKPGFLNKNRLNVLFSRARCGLYVVGDATAWAGMRYDDADALKSFRTQLMPYRCHTKEAVSSTFFDSDVLADYAEDE